MGDAAEDGFDMWLANYERRLGMTLACRKNNCPKPDWHVPDAGPQFECRTCGAIYEDFP